MLDQDALLQRNLDHRAKQQADAERDATKGSVALIREWVGLDVDLGRLDGDEVRELRELLARITYVADADRRHVRAWNLEVLDRKERKRFEKLVEKGAGQKGAFKQRRDDEAARAEGRKILDDVRLSQRPRRPKLVAPGTVQLPGWLFDAEWLGGDNGFGVGELGILALILGAIDNRVDWIPGARVEGDELVVNMDRGGLGGYNADPEQLLMPRRTQLVDYLVACKLLTAEKAGMEWRISRGPGLVAEQRKAEKS